MRRKTKLLGAIVGIFVGIQFIPVERPAVEMKNPNDLFFADNLTDSVAVFIKNSCYDCHSNETNYPWYSYVFPSSLLVARDTKVGREELNFSDWGNHNKLKKLQLLNDMEEEILSDEMPMKIYTLMHPSAKLTTEEKALVLNWIDEYRNALFK